MFLDNENDSENEQRWKNFIFFKMPMTNTERDELIPIIGVILILLLIIAAVCGIFKNN